MEWTQIRVDCRSCDLDTVVAVMSVIDESLMIEDLSDADQFITGMYGELVDEKFRHGDRTHARVSLFLGDNSDTDSTLSFLRERFAASGIEAAITVSGRDDSEWENEWRKYYKPLRIGKHIIVRPPWEEADAGDGDLVITIDPGMAFGTGSHETTRLALTLVERYMKKGARVLDVGTGSGILAIGESMLGASSVDACDLDDNAVSVAAVNIAANNITNVRTFASDLLSAVECDGGKYDFISANIVADIILRMVPELNSFITPNGIVVFSGIIDSRADDILSAMAENGFTPVGRVDESDWCALAFSAGGKREGE